MSKLARFRSRHGEPKRNPPLATDVAEYLLPGFAAFAAARVTTRMAAVQIAKRYPKAAKHAGAIAAVGAFAAAWWGAHKVKYLEKYHHPIVVGSGLAAALSIVQLYIPKLSALLGDPCPQPAAPRQMLASSAGGAATVRQIQMAPQPRVPNGFTQTTASEWYAYNDSFDAGSYKGKVEVPTAQASPPPETDQDEIKISELLDNSDLELDNSDLGLS
jgi:hypothetical protein